MSKSKFNLEDAERLSVEDGGIGTVVTKYARTREMLREALKEIERLENDSYNRFTEEEWQEMEEGNFYASETEAKAQAQARAARKKS